MNRLDFDLFSRSPAGGFFCFLFFVLLLFASLTSSVSILEIFVPYVTKTFPKVSRTKASIMGGVICLLLVVVITGLVPFLQGLFGG